MQLAAQSIRGVLGSVDHQCLTWCPPMIHRLNEILVASAGAHGPRLDLPSLLAGAGTVWETPSLATLPRVSIWPGRPGFPSATVAIEFNDTASKGSSSSESTAGRFLLRLHSQLLSMPQKLTLRCSAPVGTPKLYAVSEGSTAFRCVWSMCTVFCADNLKFVQAAAAARIDRERRIIHAFNIDISMGWSPA